MNSSKENTLENTLISSLSVYELLRYTDQANFMENSEAKNIVPISLTINSGVFTKDLAFDDYPNVAVSQVGSSLITVCSCGAPSAKLCVHQAEVIHSILTRHSFRLFYDQGERLNYLQQVAEPYGLASEPDLDRYFELGFVDGWPVATKRLKTLLEIDHRLEKELLSKRPSVVKKLAQLYPEKKRILILGRHRYYKQIQFSLVEADETKAGKIKHPIENIDPQKLIWQSKETAIIKFYSAIANLQQKYTEDELETDSEILQYIVANPLELDFYYHDREISEKISPKSLIPAGLRRLEADIHLTVNKKDPFYEVSGQLRFLGLSVPFTNLVIKNEYFLFHQQTFYFIERPELLRIIRFFKAYDEFLLIHASKYQEFQQNILDPLGDLIYIEYGHIHKANPAQLGERDWSREALVYLQQEGQYIAVTPVMKYGNTEVPVYSKKQIFDTDQNGNTFQIDRDEDAELGLTTMIMTQHPEFKEQLHQQEYFYLHQDKFLDQEWFLNAFDSWRKSDITILGFNELKSNRITPYRAKINIEVNSGMDWFNANVQIRFGSQTVPLKQLRRAIRNRSKYIELDDGTHGLLPEEWMEKIAQYLRAGDIDQELLKIPKINFSDVKNLFDQEVLSQEVQEEIKSLQTDLSQDTPIPVIPIPKKLQAELRSYQQEGLNWLSLLDSRNFGGCLADDMGLGKTLQVIAFILAKEEQRGQGTDLIVVPTSLLFNWQEELARFAPSLRVGTYHGSNRSKGSCGFKQNQIILTTYGTVLSDISLLKTFPFDCVFLDESQAIKNPLSERYKALRLLLARNRFVLTGTPIENNSFDLYGQLSFACPGLLGSRKYFKDVYAIPIDKFEYGKRMRELQKKVQPFILRRTKKQVAKELPDKTEMVIYCEMNEAQRSIYNTYEEALREYIEAVDEEGVLENRIHVLAGLTKLRQICNAPFLLQEGHAPDLSVKLEVLAQQIASKSKEHKILVFSQFVGMLDLIQEKLKELNIALEYLSGQTQNRGTAVHNFQSNPQIRVFLISLKAGGIGLNLTEADYVYIVDPWWNPAAENQAIDRSYRIGQSKNVVAVRLICKDTIEEKIMGLQKKKNKLAHELINPEQSFFTQLSKTDLLDLL